MAQYYQIQNLDDLKQIYADVQVVHVASDDVGQIVLDETQQILLQNDGPQQVVYQTQGTPTQYQPPQAGTHYTILGEDMNQPQSQTVQHQQVQQQQPQAPQQQQHQQQPQQQQQQVLMHQQHHQVLDPQQQQQQQQHQLQATYQLPQEAQQQPQHMQTQDHQMQQHVQAQPQQIYYTTDQLVHQQQQQHKKVYIQQQPQQLQQQYQPHPQHQQQMLHQAPPPQPQQQPQQHILQSPQHHPQQVQVQHQVSPGHQQQTQQQPQIIYRMQPQQTQQLQQLIVQQPSGQQVLIQQPQQQELIMRQSMPQQRIIYNNRVLYSTPQQSPQQPQQHTVMGQSPQTHQPQHIQLQTTHATMQQHHNQTHLVQQTRVVPSQHQQQQQQAQQQTPPPPPQQMQQNVVYQQIQVQNNQMPKTLMQQQQTQNSPQHQQHIQLQHQQQQQTQMVTQTSNPNGATIIRAGVARGGKIGRGGLGGTLIARMPGLPGVTRAEIRPGFNASSAIGGGGGQILRTPRPRCSTTVGSTTRGRGRGRAAAANVSAGRGSPILANNPQLGTLQQGKLVTQTLPNQGIRQVYRTQVNDAGMAVQQQHPQQHQQVHLVQAQPRMPGVASRFRAPVIGTQPQQHQQQVPSDSSPAQPTSSAGASASGSSGLGDLDLEDSIQAVFVKKDAQQTTKVAAAGVTPNQNTTTVINNNSSTPVSGTTLTTFYTAKDDDENRMIRTQNGTCMSLAEFKKRNTNASTGNQIIQNPAPVVAGGIKPLQQTAGGAKISLPAAGGQSLHSVPVARVAPQKHIVNKEQGSVATTGGTGNTATTSSAANPQTTSSGPPAGSSVYQTSHNNYEIQTQHVLQNRAGQQMAEKDRNSAKMLVILVSGEQRLITFTLPRESCTVQDLLEQVGVPFDNSTTIQCVENPGANIDFVVTVGFSVQESPSELISRAEQSLQISRQQESMQQNAAAVNAGSQSAAAATSASESNVQNAGAPSTTSTPASNTAQSSTESSAKETNTAKTATTANATANSASTASSKTTEELPQRKLIQGFYAICQICGFSGYDHAKCERCKRVFIEPPKKIPIKQATAPSLGNNFGNSNSSGSAESQTPSSSSGHVEKKRHSEGLTQRGKSSMAYNPNASSTRGRGSSQSGRGRGSRSGRRAAESEPVILTLSSDEEDDESSNKGNLNMGALAKPSNSSSSASLASYKPFAFEPDMPDPDETVLYNDFTRGDVTDLTNCSDKLSCSLSCKLIRFGTYRFEPSEQVIITSLGIRIVAPLETNPSETFALNIYKNEVVKIIAHFSKTSSVNSMLCFYTLRNCAQYIRTSLKMAEVSKHIDGVTYFSANGPYQIRKIILQFVTISEQAKSVIRSIWDFLDEISETDAQDLLQRAADSDKKLASNKNNSENIPTTTQLQPNEVRQLLIYPPGKGGIAINTEDYMCLATDQYLNDIIIDFYLKWVHDNVIPEAQKERTHIFSTFFYKRLTTLTRHTHQDKDGGKLTPAQKRHARVQNWTKNVNLFEKDFIVIPINEQSHWFLAIICFPRLKGPVTFDTNTPVELQPIKKTKGKKVSLQIGNTTITPLSKRDSANVLSEICGVDDDSERDEAEGDDSDLASEDSDFDNTSSSTTLNNSQPATPIIPGTTTSSAHQPIKQPLILIFDSLAGASRSRVVATLRDYLTCEYKIKMTDAPLHSFNKDNMPGHCVKVPQQNNFTDCGLYLLQYVEQFFKDPIRDYRVPIKQLAQWFDTLTVTRKREDISNLIQKLMNERNGPNNKIILPEIPFPTLNGQLVEPEGYNIEFEEGEMDDDDEEENTTGDMDELSTDDTSKSKTPIKMPTTTTPVVASTTTAALVPTQGRKIVVKRRMQISGNNDLNTSQVNTTATATTCGTPPSSGSTSGHPRTSMAKIRKVES
ncbi:sentrin-specific protease 6 veloren isoform 2-T7 [Cochliomyia hominivorax]